jgi:hypothetical protein
MFRKKCAHTFLWIIKALLLYSAETFAFNLFTNNREIGFHALARNWPGIVNRALEKPLICELRAWATIPNTGSSRPTLSEYPKQAPCRNPHGGANPP